MQDPNTQQGQVQEAPVIDFSTIIPSMPKLENQGSKAEPVQESQEQIQEQPEVPVNEFPVNEFPVNEFIIVDGEKVEVNLDEIIGNQPIKLRETDNPKSYKFFQAKYSKDNKRLKELEDMVKTIQKPHEVKSEIKPEPPKRPEFPQRPKNYDPTEAVTDPNSESFKYERAKEDYYLQRDVYDRYKEEELFSFKGQIEAERLEQLKSKEELAYQAHILGQIQQVGGVDVAEAKEIWEIYSTPKKDEDFLKDIVEFHHFKKGQKSPQAQKAIEQFNRSGQRQNQYVPPPGIIGSQSAPETSTLGDALIETVKKYRI